MSGQATVTQSAPAPGNIMAAQEASDAEQRWAARNDPAAAASLKEQFWMRDNVAPDPNIAIGQKADAAAANQAAKTNSVPRTFLSLNGDTSGSSVGRRTLLGY